MLNYRELLLVWTIIRATKLYFLNVILISPIFIKNIKISKKSLIMLNLIRFEVSLNNIIASSWNEKFIFYSKESIHFIILTLASFV